MFCGTIRQVARQFRQGEVTPSDVCAHALSLVEKTKHLNAFITVVADLAKQQASDSTRRFREGKPLGPLDGIPIAVKDNYCVTGIRTTCASRMLENYVAPYTATIVQKLLDQGIILLGKTNMDEFAMGCGSVDSIFGPVRNPWGCKNTVHQKTSSNTFSVHSKQWVTNEDFHIAGGSSGGSAVVVATGCALGALASDTGGSTRNPAALCGVIGVKPTYGLLSRHGLIPLVNSMDVPGFHTSNVDDAALLFGALIGRDPLDSTSVDEPIGSLSLPSDISVHGLCIGIPKEYHTEGMDPEIVRVWKQTADLLANAGAVVRQVSLPHTQYSIACYSVLNNCEVASNFARYDGIEYGHRAQSEESTEALYATSRHEGFNDTVRGRILAGNYFLLRRNYEKYFLHALKVRRLIMEDFHKVFQSGIQFLLSPVTIGTAPLYSQFLQKDEWEQTSLQDVCTQPANMAASTDQYMAAQGVDYMRGWLICPNDGKFWGENADYSRDFRVFAKNPGIPAISVPIQLSSEKLPISLQVMGPIYSDAELLTLAKWIEQTVQFPALANYQLVEANSQ